MVDPGMTLAAMSRPMTKTDEILTRMRKRILAGEFGDSGRLPTEAVLMAELDVGRITIREVFKRLMMEGLVVSRQRDGRYVHLVRPITLEIDRYEAGEGAAGRDGLDQWETAVRAQGREPFADPEVHILRDDDQAAPLIRDLLGMTGSDDGVVVRSRVCFVDRIPWMIRDSFFPEPIARGTILMKPGNQVAPGGLLAAIGLPAAEWRDTWRGRMPTIAETERLSLPQVTPGMDWTRQRIGPDGTPLAVMRAFLPGDRVQLAAKIAAR